MTAIKRLIPNLFTAGNLVGGILAIIFSLTGRIDLAPYCIFASAIFDFLDGFMARLLKVPSEMGKQLDSLADMVTFGVAPGVMVFVLLDLANGFTQTSVIQSAHNAMYGNLIDSSCANFDMYISDFAIINDGIFISGLDVGSLQHGHLPFPYQSIPWLAFLIPVFALFRLAKFNIDTRQSDSFIGLPTPAMTLFFASILVIMFTSSATIFNSSNSFLFLIHPWVLATLTVIMSILMVVELPLFALKFKHFKWKGNEIRFIFLTICILLLATLFFWAIPLIIILYVILSLINTRIAK